MRSLSNLFRGNDQSPRPVECRPVRLDEARPALSLILGTDDAQAMAHFLGFAEDRGVNLSDTWVARDNQRLWWAILPVVSPGRTMLLFSPASAPDQTHKQAAGLLAEAVCAQYRRAGVQLAQVMLEVGEVNARQAYQSAGFIPMAELEYLQTALWRRPGEPVMPEGFSLVSYSPQTHDLFAAAILASYQDSRDCPALNGLRDIQDIILGHKASGIFDPDLWWVLCEGSRPAGVLLLNPTPRSETMELVYLGLAPGARGRGLSDVLMRQALHATHAAGRRRLALAVDASNPPALKLYYRHGLHRVGKKLAMIRDLRAECH